VPHWLAFPERFNFANFFTLGGVIRFRAPRCVTRRGGIYNLLSNWGTIFRAQGERRIVRGSAQLRESPGLNFGLVGVIPRPLVVPFGVLLFWSPIWTFTAEGLILFRIGKGFGQPFFSQGWNLFPVWALEPGALGRFLGFELFAAESCVARDLFPRGQRGHRMPPGVKHPSPLWGNISIFKRAGLKQPRVLFFPGGRQHTCSRF